MTSQVPHSAPSSNPKSISRRQFNFLTAASAAATTLGTASAARAVGPNDKIGLVVIGVNGRGGEHIQGFSKVPNVEIRAIVDIDPKVGEKRAAQIAEMQGKRPVVYQDMRKAFESKDIDIVSCATPNHWHALCGVWAMQAGKDIYLEKPISHNIHEGRALVEAAKKYNKMLQTGTQTRSSQAAIDAMKFIKEGGIGEVNLARALCYKRRKSIGPLGDYAVPANVDFDMWSGPAAITSPKVTRQQFHYDWHWQRLYGNGDSGNQGPHQTDVARWGLGLDRHPTSVITYGGRLGYQAERKNPDYIDAGDTANTEVSIFDYGDKCIVFETRGLSVDNSGDEELNKLFKSTSGNKVGVVFYGSQGYLVQKTYSDFVAYDRDMNEIKQFKTKDNLNTAHMGNFVDACVARDSSKLTADAMVGHLSAAVSHLGNISYYLGESNKVSADVIKKALANVKSLDDNDATLVRTLDHLKANGVEIDSDKLSLGPQLSFDPTSEKFTNNEAANAMISREYRKGFEV